MMIPNEIDRPYLLTFNWSGPFNMRNETCGPRDGRTDGKVKLNREFIVRLVHKTISPQKIQ